MGHLLRDLGWVDFDLDAAPSCPAAQPILPNSNLSKQNQLDSGTAKIKVNPAQLSEQMHRPVLRSVDLWGKKGARNLALFFFAPQREFAPAVCVRVRPRTPFSINTSTSVDRNRL